MTISYKWLSEYLPEIVKPEKLAHILTSIGLEVEAVEDYEEFKGGLKGLLVGEVLTCEQHPNADKLLVLKVDLGFEVRTICAGIKAFYAPEAILGRNIIIVANLAPRKLRGIESHGMLLAASNDDHSQVVLLTTEKDDVAAGSVCG